MVELSRVQLVEGKKMKMKYNLTLSGCVRPKKNSKRLVHINGRMIPISSQIFMDWHEDAMKQLCNLKIPQLKLSIPLTITATFYQPDDRKRDLSNQIESVNDLLVDYGFLEDDNRRIVQEVHLYDGGIDRKNPRCVIEVETKEV